MSGNLPETPKQDAKSSPEDAGAIVPVEKQAVKQVEDVIEQTAPQILKPQREELAKRVLTITQQQFSGPIPPPALLAEYEKIVPGSALRIFNRAETQSDHRIAMEAKVIPAQQDHRRPFFRSLKAVGPPRIHIGNSLLRHPFMMRAVRIHNRNAPLVAT